MLKMYFFSLYLLFLCMALHANIMANKIVVKNTSDLTTELSSIDNEANGKINKKEYATRNKTENSSKNETNVTIYNEANGKINKKEHITRNKTESISKNGTNVTTERVSSDQTSTEKEAQGIFSYFLQALYDQNNHNHNSPNEEKTYLLKIANKDYTDNFPDFSIERDPDEPLTRKKRVDENNNDHSRIITLRQQLDQNSKITIKPLGENNNQKTQKRAYNLPKRAILGDTSQAYHKNVLVNNALTSDITGMFLSYTLPVAICWGLLAIFCIFALKPDGIICSKLITQTYDPLTRKV